MNSDEIILYYVIGTAVGVLILYFLFRWIFAIDKRVHQNKSIINLLTIIAKKQGATSDEIHNALNH